MKTSFTGEQLADHLERIDRIGYTILEDVVPKDAVAAMAAAFEPLYQSNLDTIRRDPNRGPMRHYIVLPFTEPFYQSTFNGHPDIFAIVRAILGEDVYCTQFAVHRGSPNTTDIPRGVAVLGFDREGHERGHLLENGICPQFYNSLNADEQFMYRKVPRKES